jgi:UDP-N-acetylglucosamine 2-epimerase (non-hydrolysing)
MKIACVVGTRPEAIKMAPVIWELKRRIWAEVSVWSTAQHRQMVEPLLEFFQIRVDRDLDVMTPNQSLSGLTAKLLDRLAPVIVQDKPDLVIAQGDTTTVMATAMACFYAGIRFAHVEAGLRTGDLHQPFPEEFNRLLVSLISWLNFAPTRKARDNLLGEGVRPDSIFVTGNTVIDTLLSTVSRAPPLSLELQADQRLMLVTLHRRESFGAPLEDVFGAILRLVSDLPDLVVLYPVHPNPNVADAARAALGRTPRIHLTQPLDYPQIVASMRASSIILTDSGGIQEEAPAMGKPVFVARKTTERPEAVDCGCAQLVGSDPDLIYRAIRRVLDDPAAYKAMGQGVSPYGDGHASQRIADAIESMAAPEKRGLRLFVAD